MAKASNIAPIKTASPQFQIDDAQPVPPRTKNIDDRGLPALFAQMKAGQSVVIPFDKVPVAETRTLVQRFARNGGPADAKGKGTAVDMVTRTEKDADGNAIGLRVWRNS